MKIHTFRPIGKVHLKMNSRRSRREVRLGIQSKATSEAREGVRKALSERRE